MKRAYTIPQTDVAMMEMAMNICHVSADGNVKIAVGAAVEGIKIE